jgi:hypothetical protein
MAGGGSYEFDSQNRDVVLTLPADVSARMKISTMNGQLRSADIAATTTGMEPPGTAKTRGKSKGKGAPDDDGEQTFTAVYGGGAARVTIEVFNGDVVVRKKP